MKKSIPVDSIKESASLCCGWDFELKGNCPEAKGNGPEPYLKWFRVETEMVPN